MKDIDLIKYEKLAALNNEDAIYALVNYYQSLGNYVKAFSYLTRIVNSENPTYLRKIGYFFEKGLGVEENKEKAFEYYLRSSEKGDYISQYNVAICYLNGVGVERNTVKAFYYANISASQNYEKSRILLANMYRNGEICEKNLDLAMTSLSKCSPNDNGVLYLKSLILLDKSYSNYNPALAIDYLSKGAFNNDTKCLLTLASLYLKGNFVPKDESKSLSLLLKAAKNGSAAAMEKLSEYYEYGIGTLKNLDIAQFWKSESEKRKWLKII